VDGTVLGSCPMARFCASGAEWQSQFCCTCQVVDHRADL
jgi:hypothetical protein